MTKSTKTTEQHVHNLLRMAKGVAKRGETGMALKLYEKALTLAPDDIDIHYKFADLLEKANQIERAEEIVHQGLKRSPKNPKLLFVQARLLRRKSQHGEAIILLKDVLGDVGENDKLKARLLFELGRLHEKIGESELAYHYFQEGNRLISQLTPEINPADFAQYSIAPFEKNLSKMTGIQFTAGDEAPPVFLVGFPRSGTTLLEMILDSHPAVTCMEEINIIPYLHGQFGLNQADGVERLIHLSDEEAVSSRESYFNDARRYSKWQENTQLVDKYPLNTAYLPLILRLFPQARILFALRHPYDVCLSCFTNDFGMNSAMANFLTLESTARFYARVMGFWLNIRKYLAPTYLGVHYERLVGDFHEQTHQITDFLGLDWHPQMESFFQNERILNGKIHTPSYHQVARPIYSQSIGRWKSYAAYFTPQIREILAPFVDAFGYSTEE